MRLVAGGWSLDEDRALLARSDPTQGFLAFSAPPEARSAGRVAAACLAALGKSRRAAPASRVAADETRLAAIWLEAHRVQEVAILGAARMATEVCRQIGAVVESTGARLSLVVDPPALPHLASRLVELRSQPPLGLDALLAEIEAITGRSPAPVGSADAALADVEGRRRALEAPVAPDDAVYLWAYATVAVLPRDERPTKARTAAALRGILEPLGDVRCFAAASAGAAAALLPVGWELTLDRGVLARGIPPAPRPSNPSWAPTYRAFWIFRDPLPGALWVLTRLPVTLEEVLELRLGDVADDGSMVGIRGEWFTLPDDARPLLRAQTLARTWEGGRPSDAFVVRGTGQPSAPWAVSVLRATAAEASVRFLDDELGEHPGPDERWLDDRGLSLRWIPRLERTDRGLGRGGPTERDRAVDRALAASMAGRRLGRDRPCVCADAHRLAGGALTPQRLRRCRHGLVADLLVDGVRLTHSQRLCSAPVGLKAGPAAVRPAAAGFGLRELERTDSGVRIAVSRRGVPAGELIGIEGPAGFVWFQLGAASAPALARVAAATRQGIDAPS